MLLEGAVPRRAPKSTAPHKALSFLISLRPHVGPTLLLQLYDPHHAGSHQNGLFNERYRLVRKRCFVATLL